MLHVLLELLDLGLKIIVFLIMAAIALAIVGFVLWFWWFLICLVVKIIFFLWPVIAVIFVVAFLAKAISR